VHARWRASALTVRRLTRARWNGGMVECGNAAPAERADALQAALQQSEHKCSVLAQVWNAVLCRGYAMLYCRPARSSRRYSDTTCTVLYRSLSSKCSVLAQELARTEGVRVAAELEAKARIAAEHHAAQVQASLAAAKAELKEAHADAVKGLGLAKALEEAAENASLAKQVLVDKDQEIAVLNKRLEAAKSKTDAVRAKERPLLHRLHQVVR
jgi:hypothetical protein